MEHIVLNWEDIVQLLLDELIDEEVHELNRIEYKQQPAKKKSQAG